MDRRGNPHISMIQDQRVICCSISNRARLWSARVIDQAITPGGTESTRQVSSSLPSGPRFEDMIPGLELGGTSCVALLGSENGDIHAHETVPTTDPTSTLSALEAVLDRLRFDALGVASFGPLGLGQSGI
jgi:hypothetical protein